MEQLSLGLLLWLALVQLSRAVNATDSGIGAGRGHLERLLHLRFLLQLLDRLHDDVVEAGALNDFSLREAGYLVIVVVPLEKFLGRVAPK